MVDKLEAGKTYRLIDAEGYFKSHSVNRQLFDKYFTDDMVKIDKVQSSGSGMANGSTLVATYERKYFELVEEEDNMRYPLGKPDYSSGWFLPVKDDVEYVVVKTALENLGCEFFSESPVLGGYTGIGPGSGVICRTNEGWRCRVGLLEAIKLLFPQKSRQDLQKEELNASIKKMEAELAKMKQQLEEY